MTQRKHQALAMTYLLIDASASILAMLSAWFLRFVAEIIPVTKGQQELEVYTHILPLVVIVFPVAFALQGLYQIRPARGRTEEGAAVVISSLLATILLSGLLLWLRPGDPGVTYSRATLAIFTVCEIVFVILGRSLLRTITERNHRRGRNLDRVLIAGSGPLAVAVAERIGARSEMGLQIVGFVDDDPAASLNGITRLGALRDAESVVQTMAVDHVYVALPQESGRATLDLVDRLFRHCVSIHVIPDLMQFMALRSRVEDLDGLPTVDLTGRPIEGWSLVIKRLLDLAFSLFALIVLSPLMLLVAVAIYLEDRGPILYRQIRMGLDGIPFEILKFRSMRMTAEQESGAVWADRDDPRRTRVGRIIRSWSLDELPQIWNVICGEMSLVGPRPERPEFVEQFRAEFPHYMLRHKVRAGITGWAQVNGWRGNTSIRKRIEHDLYYIENWSLVLDLKILAMTLRYGVKHENAY